MRTRTSRPCGFGVSTMVSHKGASNLTSDWRRISAMAWSPWDSFLEGGCSGRLRFCLAYIGQFLGHGNKAGDRDRLGAAGGIDPCCGSQRRRIDRERFEALPQHFAALAEGRGRYLLER